MLFFSKILLKELPSEQYFKCFDGRKIYKRRVLNLKNIWIVQSNQNQNYLVLFGVGGRFGDREDGVQLHQLMYYCRVCQSIDLLKILY